VFDIYATARDLRVRRLAREQVSAALALISVGAVSPDRVRRTTRLFSLSPLRVSPTYVIWRFTGDRPVATVVTSCPVHVVDAAGQSR
jgi:hypothetical protein